MTTADRVQLTPSLYRLIRRCSADYYKIFSSKNLNIVYCQVRSGAQLALIFILAHLHLCSHCTPVVYTQLWLHYYPRNCYKLFPTLHGCRPPLCQHSQLVHQPNELFHQCKVGQLYKRRCIVYACADGTMYHPCTVLYCGSTPLLLSLSLKDQSMLVECPLHLCHNFSCSGVSVKVGLSIDN